MPDFIRSNSNHFQTASGIGTNESLVKMVYIVPTALSDVLVCLIAGINSGVTIYRQTYGLIIGPLPETKRQLNALTCILRNRLHIPVADYYSNFSTALPLIITKTTGNA